MRTYWHKVDGDWKFACEESDEFPHDKAMVADVAIWTTPLTETEIKALAGGARPMAVARKKLKEYHPLDAIVSK